MAYIFRRKNKIYYAALSPTGKYKSGKDAGRRNRWLMVSLHTTSKVEAYDRLQTIIKQLKDPVGIDNTKETTPVLLKDFLMTTYFAPTEDPVKYKGKRSLREDKYNFKKFLRFLDHDEQVKQNSDHLLLREVTPQLIKNFITSMMNTLSTSTINRALTSLKAGFSYATSIGLLQSSPAQGIKALPVPTKKGIKYLSGAEIKSFLDTCKAQFTHYYPIFFIMLTTGIRRAEATNLIAETDVDFLTNTLIVQSKQSDPTRGICGFSPKNFQLRELPLPDDAVALLKHLPSTASPYLFVSKQGGKIGDGSLSKKFKEICASAGIRDKTLHCLRHTFAVQNLRTGRIRSLEALRQYLGHSSYKTVQIYSRFAVSDLIASENNDKKFWEEV